MGIEFGWKVATEVIGWLQQAVSAAKDRRQQRFAHIIGNAGVIVAGLRSIDRELRRLFLPLVYFDPEGWPADKRREWAERILSVAYEDVILPRMRAADSALATLASQETDAEIVGLIEQLRYVEPLQPHPPIGSQGSVRDLLDVAIRTVDVRIGDYLPRIVEALLGEEQEAMADVRRMAEGIIGRNDSNFPYGLRRLADAAERTFGFLMGHQQQKFPNLPAPTWVWDS